MEALKIPATVFGDLVFAQGLVAVSCELLQVFGSPFYVGCSLCKKKYPEVC
jgi:hypothetical protein